MTTGTLVRGLVSGLCMLAALGCAARERMHSVGSREAGVREALPEPWRTVLEQSDSMELLALDPFTGGPFHGHGIRGRAVVRQPAERRRLIEALYLGINRAEGAAACFVPRHGLRVRRGTLVLEFEICFECGYFEVGSVDSQLSSGGSTTASAEAVFDAALRAHGLSKAPGTLDEEREHSSIRAAAPSPLARGPRRPVTGS